jgi:hypothetical protein
MLPFLGVCFLVPHFFWKLPLFCSHGKTRTRGISATDDLSFLPEMTASPPSPLVWWTGVNHVPWKHQNGCGFTSLEGSQHREA